MYRLNVELNDEQEKFLRRLDHGMKRLLISVLITKAMKRIENGESIFDIVKEGDKDKDEG
jgi:hypothetical protein